MVWLNVLVTQARGIQWNLTVLVMTWIAPLEVKLRAHSTQIENIPLASLRLKVNLTELQGYFCHGNTLGGETIHFSPVCVVGLCRWWWSLKKFILSKLQHEHFQRLSSGKIFRFFFNRSPMCLCVSASDIIDDRELDIFFFFGQVVPISVHFYGWNISGSQELWQSMKTLALCLAYPCSCRQTWIKTAIWLHCVCYRCLYKYLGKS